MSLGTQENPLRVCVIGSGPAGFYAAEAFAKHKTVHAEVDVFERLPAPYGLVRYGVAPDHQKIKSVTVAYDRLCENPKVRFLGNVRVAEGDISVEELLSHYHQVVIAVGCPKDRQLGIPGEDLVGSHSATSFVAWYNGHPDFTTYPVNLGVTHAAVVGVGDVSMDIARMLLRSPTDLMKTDIAAYAADAFAKNTVTDVTILARRGPGQAAFAAKELEDIADLPDVDVIVDGAQVEADLNGPDELDGLMRRKLEYLATLAKKERRGAPKRLTLRFLASPAEILGTGTHVEGLRIEENAIVRDERGRAAAKGTGRFETLPVGLVFRAVGYRGTALDGIPFDEKGGIIPNADGRVLRGGEPLPRLYVAGWIKRGPSGVIGTNKGDAAATVQKMLEDMPSLPQAPDDRKNRAAVDALLAGRGVSAVTFADWKRLDRMEREEGEKRGKVREKFVTVPAFLSALGRGG